MPVVSGPTPTRAQLLTLLRGFLILILPNGVEIVEGQPNRVPQPTAPDSVVMTPMSLKRIRTNVTSWTGPHTTPNVMTHEQDVAAEVELQVFGAGSTDNVNIMNTLLRSAYACDYFDDSGITPLYCDEGKQIPFITGEDQYQDRWVLRAVFQMNITLATAQQFADTLTVGIKEVDTYYPPGAP